MFHLYSDTTTQVVEHQAKTNKQATRRSNIYGTLIYTHIYTIYILVYKPGRVYATLARRIIVLVYFIRGALLELCNSCVNGLDLNITNKRLKTKYICSVGQEIH